MTYTLKEYNVSDFKDQNGNSYVNAAFEEFGEPVTLVVKDPSKLSVGQKLDGEIKPKPRTNGNGTYNRFYRDKPQDFQGGGSYSSQPKKQYTDNSDGQRQGMCINNAAQYIINLGTELTPQEFASEVKKYAQALYTIDLKSQVEEVKAIMNDENFDDKEELKKQLADIPF